MVGTTDTKGRSLAKSIVWRVIGIAIMPPIIYGVYACVGDDRAAVAFWTTVIFHAIRVALYYYHERAWEMVSWGKRRSKEAQWPIDQGIG